jgi:hypothetical protein
MMLMPDEGGGGGEAPVALTPSSVEGSSGVGSEAAGAESFDIPSDYDLDSESWSRRLRLA